MLLCSTKYGITKCSTCVHYVIVVGWSVIDLFYLNVVLCARLDLKYLCT